MKGSSTFKQLACKRCGNIVAKVDINSDAVTCSDCVQLDLLGGIRLTEEQYWEAVRAGKIVSCKKEESEEK
jgi:hypothetical protein